MVLRVRGHCRVYLSVGWVHPLFLIMTKSKFARQRRGLRIIREASSSRFIELSPMMIGVLVCTSMVVGISLGMSITEGLERWYAGMVAVGSVK